ncbi:MAG: PD40 domain-containing protein, partial [Myxococcales bacterium]|nr:PD40 domain-containing protein [Myxococcales bacterium]
MRRAPLFLLGLTLLSCATPAPGPPASPGGARPPAPAGAAGASGGVAGSGSSAAAWPASGARAPATAGAEPSGASAAADVAAASGAGAAGSTYRGHGAESIAPEVLARYRPPPLPPEIASRVEALMDVRAPGAGRLSPDGKSLFFSWSITGVPQIWKVDGPRRFPEELTGGEDATALAAITPDGKWLVVQRDRKGEENPGLYLQAPAGGPLVEIQHERRVQTHFEQASSDGAYVYFTANDVKPASYVIYRFDVARRLKEKVFDEDGLWHVSDLRDDGRLLLRKETGELWAEYYELDPAKKALTPLFGQGEYEEYDARYGAKEGEIFVLTNKFGEYRRLYAFLAGSFTPLGSDVRFDVAGFDVDRRRTRVLYTTNEGGYTRPHALDARTRRPLALPPLPPADHVLFGPTTPDARYTTVSVDDGRHPPQGYVLDWRTSHLEAWHSPSTPEVDTTRFARAEAETY